MSSRTPRAARTAPRARSHRQAVPIVAAQRRDDTEGAFVVAALRDLDLRAVARCGEHTVPRRRDTLANRGLLDSRARQGQGPTEREWFRAIPLRALDSPDNFRNFARSEHSVDLGYLFLQLVA